MRMTVAVAMPVELVRPAAEAAIGHAVASHDRATVQATRHLAKQSGAAVTSLDESH